MIRHNPEQNPHNHERWLISYADFITLLFAFFVVMYSISSVNESKYLILSDALGSAFADPSDIVAEYIEEPDTVLAEAEPIQTDIVELPPVIEQSQPPPVSEETIRTINDISQQLNSTFAEMINNEDISINQGDDWLELDIKSKLLFSSGEARLGASSIPIIRDIATILNTSSNPIQVEGFTDDRPINTARFPSNWELSAARAASVVHLLERFQVSPERMAAIGYGQFKPIADNATSKGRQENRRIVLVILGEDHSRRDIKVFKPQSASPSQTIPPPTNVERTL